MNTTQVQNTENQNEKKGLSEKQRKKVQVTNSCILPTEVVSEHLIVFHHDHRPNPSPERCRVFVQLAKQARANDQQDLVAMEPSFLVTQPLGGQCRQPLGVCIVHGVLVV